MSITTAILDLRGDRSSSVEALLAALEWQKAAQGDGRLLSRGYAVAQAIDIVLLNVAAHTADALNELTPIPTARRSHAPSRRQHRRPEPPQLHQSPLFALAPELASPS